MALRIFYLLSVVMMLVSVPTLLAQGIVDGKTNLITNGNAESGSASTDGKTVVASIPAWTRSGGMSNVLPYGLTGYVLLTDPAPPDHAFNYFAGDPGGGASTLTQVIDVSSAASLISGGNVKFTASAYLGDTDTQDLPAHVTVAFQNSGGQTFNTTTVGPDGYGTTGLSLQQEIGLVPSGTTQVTVTLTLSNRYSAADSLSLVFSTLGTNTASVLGTNLIVNPGAELGPNAEHPNPAPYIPGWSTSEQVSVAPYGGSKWIGTTDPGPPDRGLNLFWSNTNKGVMYEDIDVSPAGSLIDSGQVTYEVSAWLGGLNGDSPTLTYAFFDWSGNQLAPTAQLSVKTHAQPGLSETSNSGPLPSGVRRVRITVAFSTDFNLVDNVTFALASPSGPPVITQGGIVSASAFGGFSSIAPGTWIEIYGSDLAASTTSWSGSNFVNGVAPTNLGGVTVSVGGTAAFIDYVSPTQINALVSSDAPISSGTVAITVTNANGTSDPYGIYVNQTQAGLLAPSSFQVNGKQYVAALFPDGKTFVLPQGAISGLASQPASPGDTITIYGIGFGSVTPTFDAGTLVTGQNSLLAPLHVYFGQTAATLSYDGLAPSLTGLYQFNVVVPNIPANNAVPISFNLGGVDGTQTLYIAIGN